MIAITRSFEWDMGHRVTNHDSLCKNPHGHRYKLELTVTGPVSAQSGDAQEGMIIDFGRLKDTVNERIITKLDHSFMFWDKDAVMSKFASDNPGLRFVSVPFVPTAECIAQYIADELQKALRPSFPHTVLEKVVVYETPNCRAEWRKA